MERETEKKVRAKLKTWSKSNNEMLDKSSGALTFYDDNYTYIDTSSWVIDAKDNAGDAEMRPSRT